MMNTYKYCALKEEKKIFKLFEKKKKWELKRLELNYDIIMFVILLIWMKNW